MVYWRARFLSCVVRSRRTGSSTPGPSFHRWSSGSLHTLTGFHQYRKHVSGSGSVMFRASRIRIRWSEEKIRIQILPSSSKNNKKTLDSTVLWLLHDFLSVKNDVNAPSKISRQKNGGKQIIFYWHLEGHWAGSGSVSQRSGSVNSHRYGSENPDPYGTKMSRIWNIDCKVISCLSDRGDIRCGSDFPVCRGSGTGSWSPFGSIRVDADTIRLKNGFMKIEIGNPENRSECFCYRPKNGSGTNLNKN